MASELPFEYTRRWPEIKDLLQAGQIEEAKAALEIRDRDLEEFLKTVGGDAIQGGSLVLLHEDTFGPQNMSHDNTWSPTGVSFTVPSETPPSGQYWIDVRGSMHGEIVVGHDIVSYEFTLALNGTSNDGIHFLTAGDHAAWMNGYSWNAGTHAFAQAACAPSAVVTVSPRIVNGSFFNDYAPLNNVYIRLLTKIYAI
jgi:hypothetical protein